MKTVSAKSRAAWREWLARNHDSEREAWLVFPRKETGLPGVPYEDAVEEALCFGWIDSIIRRIDDRSYARKFTHRKPGSEWSELNKARAMKVIAEGRMTGAGMTLVDEARRSGEWEMKRSRPRADSKGIPSELISLLSKNSAARKRFDSLPPSHRKKYVLWISEGKKPETRERRAAEAVRLLERGEELGLK